MFTDTTYIWYYIQVCVRRVKFRYDSTVKWLHPVITEFLHDTTVCRINELIQEMIYSCSVKGNINALRYICKP